MIKVGNSEPKPPKYTSHDLEKSMEGKNGQKPKVFKTVQSALKELVNRGEPKPIQGSTLAKKEGKIKPPATHASEILKQISAKLKKQKTLPPQLARKYSYILADLLIQNREQSDVKDKIREQQLLILDLVNLDLPLKKDLKLIMHVSNGIVDTFQKNEIKKDLDSTLDHLCQKNGVSKQDIKQEAICLYSSDNRKAKLKMIRRLLIYRKALGNKLKPTLSLKKREEKGPYPLSILSAVEKAFKSYVTGKEKFEIKKLKVEMGERDIRVIIPGDQNVYVEEDLVAKGAFKVVHTISDFFRTKTPEERTRYVSKRIEAPQDKEGMMISGLSIIESKKKVPKQGSSIYLDVGDTMLVKSSYQDTSEEEGYESSVETSIGQVVKNSLGISTEKKQTEQQPEKLGKEEMEEQKGIEKEFAFSQLFKGPGIASIHSLVALPSGRKVLIAEAAGFSFQGDPKSNEKNFVAITFADLKTLLQENPSKENVRKIYEVLGGAFKGLARIHDKGFVHCDIKPLNMLVTKKGTGVITDFDPKKEGMLLKNLVGTPTYFVPDQMTEKYAFSPKFDVWCCGLLLFDTFFAPNFYKKKGIKLPFPNPLLFTDKQLSELSKARFIPNLFSELLMTYMKELAIDKKAAKSYEKRYPEPKDPMSLEYLAWWCTRIDPNKRPSMKEFIDRYEKIIAKLQ